MVQPVVMPDMTSEQSQLPGALPAATGFQTFKAAADNALGGVTANLVQEGERAWDQYVQPGKFLSPDEVPSEFKSQYPNGVSQNLLNNEISQRTKQDYNDNVIASMPSGIDKTVSSFAGSTAGTLLDPITDTLGAIAPEAFGEQIAAKAAWGESKAAQIAAKGVAGLAEGGVVGAPLAVGQFQQDKAIGEDPSTMDLLTGLGINSLIGGAIHGAFGAYKVIRPDTAMQADAVATNQFENDKKITVDPIIQNGLNETSQTAQESGVDIQQHLSNLSDINDQISQKQNEIDGLDDQSPESPVMAQKQSELGELLDQQSSEEAAIQWLSSPPVDQKNLITQANKVNSPMGDQFMQEDANTQATIDEEEPVEDTFHQNLAQQMVNDGRLSQDDLDNVQALNDQLDQDHSNIGDILDQTFNCLEGE